MKIVFKDNELFELAPYWVASEMPSWVGKTVQQTIEFKDGCLSLTLEVVGENEEAGKK